MWLTKALVLIHIILINCEEDFHPTLFVVTLSTHLHDGNSTFTGSANISVKISEDVDVIKFHHRGLKIKSILLDDDDVEFEEDENIWELKKSFVKDSEHDVLFDYEGTFPTEFIGHYVDDDSKQNYFAAISFKSTSFLKICPSNADERLRSDFQFKIKHHPDYNAVSINDRAEIPKGLSRNQDDFLTTEFAKVENVSTSSLAFFISNFESISNDKVEVYGIPKFIHAGYFNKSLEIATKIVDEFPNYFPHIFNKLRLIAVPGITSAISARGLIINYQFNLFYQPNESPLIQIDKITRHVAHAVAQQFFGNIITPTTLSDSFITEGLARFYEYFIVSKLPPEHENHIMMQFSVEIQQSAFEIDASSLTKALVTSKLMPADELNSFAEMKSACLMRMIESVIGGETFAKGIERLLKKDEINLEDFYDEMQQAMNDDGIDFDLKDNFNDWMIEAGFPLITVTMINETNLNLTQEKFNGASSKLWKIPLTFKTSSSDQVVSDWLEERHKNLEISNFNWVIFNIDQVGYYRVNYDAILWNKIIAELHDDFTKIPSRAVLIDDAFNLALIDKISYETAFELISYKETDFLSWKVLHENLKFLDAMLFNDAEIYPKFLQFVTEIVETFYIQQYVTKTHEAFSIALFWACQVRIETAVVYVTVSFEDYLNDPSTLDVNLSEAVICNAMKINQDTQVFNNMIDKLINFEGDKNLLISALACVENADWLLNFLLMAVDQDLSGAERRQILMSGLKNVKYGSMAGVKLLMQKREALSDGEIYFVLDEVVKRFWNESMKDPLNAVLNDLKANGFDEDHLEVYSNLINQKLNWLPENRDEINNYLTARYDTTQPDHASISKINSFLLSVMIYTIINI